MTETMLGVWDADYVQNLLHVKSESLRISAADSQWIFTTASNVNE